MIYFNHTHIYIYAFLDRSVDSVRKVITLKAIYIYDIFLAREASFVEYNKMIRRKGVLGVLVGHGLRY
jgi:hypothetical protein